MEKTKKNKGKKISKEKTDGITLIALVVTIIVLLILAGISISMLSGNNGVLTNAKEANEKTKKAEYEEQVKLAVMAAKTDGKGIITESNLKNELKNNIEGLTDSDITGNEKYGWQIKIPNENKAFAVSSTGETNEAYWEEVKDANGNITEIRRVDGTVTGLKIGDTINYIATEGLDTTDDTQMQITSSRTVNGYEDQIIDLRNYDGTWKLLGLEKGNLNIISSEIVGEPKVDGDSLSNSIYTDVYLTFFGKTGYTNAETELNRICSLYGKGKNAEPGTARSINIEDINKITGYDPAHTGVNVNKATKEEILAGEPYEKNDLNQYGNRVTYLWKGDEYPHYTSNVISGDMMTSHNWSTFKGFSWWNGLNFQKSNYLEGKNEKICELILNYYHYYPETLTTTNDITQSVGLANNSVERDMLFNPGTDHYWLASKSISASSYTVAYDVCRVGNGCVSGVCLTASIGGNMISGIGLRPVVSLKSDINLEKDENGVWQFIE